MQLSVKIHKVFEDKGAMKVIDSEKGRFAAMPNEVFKDKDGNDVRRDVFHPISSSARKLMEEAVLMAYETTIKKSAE